MAKLKTLNSVTLLEDDPIVNEDERDVWADDYYGSLQYIMRGYATKREAYYALCRHMRNEEAVTPDEYPQEKELERIIVRFCPCGFWTMGSNKCCECEECLTSRAEIMYRLSIG